MMIVDFGESVIGRVVLVDLGFWWIILFCVYIKLIGDYILVDMFDC